MFAANGIVFSNKKLHNTTSLENNRNIEKQQNRTWLIKDLHSVAVGRHGSRLPLFNHWRFQNPSLHLVRVRLWTDLTSVCPNSPGHHESHPSPASCGGVSRPTTCCLRSRDLHALCALTPRSSLMEPAGEDESWSGNPGEWAMLGSPGPLPLQDPLADGREPAGWQPVTGCGDHLPVTDCGWSSGQVLSSPLPVLYWVQGEAHKFDS